MQTEIKAGFFTMETVHAVLAMSDVEEAKQFVLSSVKDARSENMLKAQRMVEKSKTIKALGINVANFLLAHPSENLKTIR